MTLITPLCDPEKLLAEKETQKAPLNTIPTGVYHRSSVSSASSRTTVPRWPHLHCLPTPPSPFLHTVKLARSHRLVFLSFTILSPALLDFVHPFLTFTHFHTDFERQRRLVALYFVSPTLFSLENTLAKHGFFCISLGRDLRLVLIPASALVLLHTSYTLYYPPLPYLLSLQSLLSRRTMDHCCMPLMYRTLLTRPGDCGTLNTFVDGPKEPWCIWNWSSTQ